MLDLEVVPERSLGNEQWEFILGELQRNLYIAYILFWRSSRSYSSLEQCILIFSITICTLCSFLRNACCTVRADSQAAMSCYQNCTGYVQRGGKLKFTFLSRKR